MLNSSSSSAFPSRLLSVPSFFTAEDDTGTYQPSAKVIGFRDSKDVCAICVR
jgi:hypothetical protein